jgi:ABC-2 type transport system ATP-binding protein
MGAARERVTLRIRNLTHRYGALLALADVDLDVGAGEVFGLLGANGAGKSTLLRTAAGLQLADSGSVSVGGADLTLAPLEARARLGYAAEEPAFYEELSCAEYLAFVAGVRGIEPGAARARADDLLARFGLAGREDDPVRTLSHGTRKKIAFVAAILHRPAVLLCDEALEGFDAAAALAAKQELRDLADAGSAILFSSHVTETIERLCDRVAILERGRIARILVRDDWGAPAPGLSPLERVFLDIHRPNAAAETP